MGLAASMTTSFASVPSTLMASAMNWSSGMACFDSWLIISSMRAQGGAISSTRTPGVDGGQQQRVVVLAQPAALARLSSIHQGRTVCCAANAMHPQAWSNSESLAAMACCANGICPTMLMTALRNSFTPDDEAVAIFVIRSVMVTTEWAIASRFCCHVFKAVSFPC
jgi:hypothetical protein